MSKTLPILTNPSPILREKSVEVAKKDLGSKKIKELCLDMAKTMHEGNGVGLAAPQIGQNIRIVVVSIEDKVIPMINPSITKKSWAKVTDEEGCLSVPGTFGKVARHKKVNCTYYDTKGQKKRITVSNFPARVIQHELDHLDGVLFIDKAKNVKEVVPE